MTHFGKMCLSLPRVSRVLHGGSSRSGVACHLRARQFSLTAGRRRPMCVVQTNLTDSDIPTDLTTQLSHLLSTMLNKPLDVSVNNNVNIKYAFLFQFEGVQARFLNVHIEDQTFRTGCRLSDERAYEVTGENNVLA